MKNDNVRSSDTRSDETITATRKQPDDEVLGNLHVRQRDKAEQLNQRLALQIPGTARKGERRSHTKVKRVVNRYLEQQTREKHFSSRDRSGEKAASVEEKGKGKEKEKEEENPMRDKDIAFNVLLKVQCSRRESCCFKHDLGKKSEDRWKQRKNFLTPPKFRWVVVKSWYREPKESTQKIRQATCFEYQEREVRQGQDL